MTANTVKVGAAPAGTGAMGLNDGNSARVLPSVAKALIWERRNMIPLTSLLLNKGTEAVTSMGPHTVFTQQEFPRYDTTDSAIAGTTETDLTASGLDFTAHGLRVHDILLDKDTDELMRVVTVTSGVPTAVTRGYGGTTATAIGSGDIFVILGNALAEGSAMIEAVQKSSRSHDAYCQIFQYNVNLTDEMAKTAHYGPTQWDVQTKQQVDNFFLQRERALLLNTHLGHAAVVSGRYQWTTGGLYGMAADNSVYTDANGTFTYDELVAAIQPLHEVGSTEKTMAVIGTTLWTQMNELANNRSDIQFNRTQDPRTGMTLGSTVGSFIGTHVDCTLMYSEAMNARPDEMIVFKPDELSLIEFSGLTSEEVKEPGTNAKSQKMQHKVGLKIKNPRTAMVLKNLVTAG